MPEAVRGDGERGGRERPDVLFVVLDSARADRLSVYGHDRATTPALESLARDATVHENAHTPAPWTLPSHCSLFTGLFPSEHGVTNGFVDRSVALPEDLETLPERLAARGYRTAGFSNNPWVGSLSGLDRGFDEFVEWDLEIGRTRGADVHTARDRLYSRGHTLLGQAARTPVYLLKRRFFTGNLVRRATRWLDRGSGPTLTFLNLMEAHSPYYPPKRAFRELGLDPPGPVEARRLNLQLTAYVLGKVSIANWHERVLAFYDASLRYQDARLSELLESLKAAGRYQDALVVVCADHGKTLGEYDRDAEPPHYLRAVNTNVPLLVKRPGQESGERVGTPCELVRLFDVVDSGGRERVAGPDAGADAGALVEDFVPHTGERAGAVTRWRALAGTDATYVRSETGAEYRLERGADGERVVDADEETLADWRDRLAARVDDLREAEPVRAGEDGADLDATVRSQLEDLGYL